MPSRTVYRLLVRRVVAFYLIAFGLAWGVEAAIIAAGGFTSVGLVVLYGMGWLAPSIAAAVMTHREGGGAAVRAHFAQLLRWRLSPAYIVALALPTLALLAGRAVVGGQGPWLQLAFGLGVLGPPLVEEPGWRGYALPRLQKHMNPLPAAVLVGVLWATWHLPLFFIPGGPGVEIIPGYLLWVTSAGVVLAWLYNVSGRLLTVAVVSHAGLNLGLVPLAQPGFPAFVVAALVMTAVAATVAIPLGRIEVDGPG
jgi:membrane protease YdiL (CAAX protease family)